MRPLAFVTVLVALSAAPGAGQAPAAGQATPGTTGLTIRVFGNLLGLVEGFCEDPGGTYDWGLDKPVKCGPENGSIGSAWLGGAIGAAAAVREAKPAPDDLLIVAGNNRSTSDGGAAWAHLTSLQPHTVALGRLDLTRTLRQSPVFARGLRDWVNTNPHLPLLVSNVSIHHTNKKLNSNKSSDGRFKLRIEDDETVSWIASLKIEHPPLASPKADIQEFARRPRDGDTSPVRTVKFDAGKGSADGTLTFERPLRPGRWYRLTIRDGDLERANFVFETDAALTPGAGPIADLVGYPVRTRLNAGLLVVAMVDPDVRNDLSNPMWRWTEADGDREIQFLDPKKALKAMLDVVRDDVTPPPTVLLVSDLSDAGTTSVIEEFPEIRFVVLPPDSALLGRAARVINPSASPAAGATRFSGDRGFMSVLDEQYESATRVMVRPEWFGETLITIRANVQAGSTNGQLDRAVTGAGAEVSIVKGAAFSWRINGSQVTYLATLGSEVETGKADTYRSCPDKSPGECSDFRNIWTSGDQFVAFIGDALRASVKTDLAVVSKDLIDADYAGYVRRHLDGNGSDWLSKYILERVVYDSRRVVKAKVSGADLVGKLNSALKEDGDYCISGIGGGCPSSLDTAHPERLIINGRRLYLNLFYSVAVPDHLAESLDLDHSDDDPGIDIVEATHQHFVRLGWMGRTEDDRPTVAGQLEAARSRNVQGYFAATKLDFGMVFIRPVDPEGRTDIRKNLGLPFSGAERSTRFAVALDSDYGAVDAQSFAIRVPMAIDYTRREESDKVTFDTDEFSTGARGDYKYRMARLYGGLFWDGQLRDHPATLSASRKLAQTRDGFDLTEKALFSTTYVVEPRRFRHYGGGAEILPMKEFPLSNMVKMSLRKFGGRLTRGTESNVPVGLSIGGADQNLDRLLSRGHATLLNEYFKANEATFSKEVEFAIETEDRRQWRFQVDADGQIKLKTGERDYTLDLGVRYRLYRAAGEPLSQFQKTSELKVEIAFGIPLWWRLKLTPAWLYEQATIEASENDLFQYSKLDIRLSLPIVMRYGQGRLIK